MPPKRQKSRLKDLQERAQIRIAKKKDLEKLKELEHWSSRYEFNFQFWGTSKNTVYITKGGVEMYSANSDTVKECIDIAITWCRYVNLPHLYKKRPEIL